MITLNRHGRGLAWKDEATIGTLTVGNVTVLTLEDDFDETKEYGHTRIPAGRYKLELRKEGRFHELYKKRFPAIHRGMIHITGVPNYTYVLIHCGNKPDDTAGCILVALKKISETFVGQSERAYNMIYPPIADLIENGDTYIDIID